MHLIGIHLTDVSRGHASHRDASRRREYNCCWVRRISIFEIWETIPHRTLVWLLRKFVSWLACLGAASPHRIENSNCNFIVTSNPGARHSIQAAATYSTSIADLMLCDSPHRYGPRLKTRASK